MMPIGVAVVGACAISWGARRPTCDGYAISPSMRHAAHSGPEARS